MDRAQVFSETNASSTLGFADVEEATMQKTGLEEMQVNLSLAWKSCSDPWVEVRGGEAGVTPPIVVGKSSWGGGDLGGKPRKCRERSLY